MNKERKPNKKARQEPDLINKLKLNTMTKLNQKSEEAKKAVDFFKGMLASYFGVEPKDIDLDVTLKNVPNPYLDTLEKEGLEITSVDFGMGSYKKACIEETNEEKGCFLIRFESRIKNNLMDAIYEICKPKPDHDDEAFETRRENKVHPIFNEIFKNINPNGAL